MGCKVIQVNLISTKEHVPKIEHHIRVIKERGRSTRHTMKFKVIQLIMLIDLIYSSTLWINAFPPKGGASDTYIPHNIMTSVQFYLNKRCQLPFGIYAQSHYDPSCTNIQAARTVRAICLVPNGKQQGFHKILNLCTVKRTTRREWTLLPLPQELINRVYLLGKY